MRNRHRVVWTKGMFLTPQHFQTQDQYLENALQFRFAASLFANWGVTGLNIDSEALGNGLFRVNDCKGILPDGEPFDIDGVRILQTVSIGVATWDHRETPEQLERRADEAMYEAKRLGRNRVVVATPTV